jgi:hypothetical protein
MVGGKVLIAPVSPEDPISSADLSFALLLLCYSHKNIPKVVEESIKAVAICIKQANVAETVNTIQLKVTEALNPWAEDLTETLAGLTENAITTIQNLKEECEDIKTSL